MNKYLSVLVLLLVPSQIWSGTVDVLSPSEWTKLSSVFICKKFGDHNECGSGTVIHCDKEGYLVLTCYHVVTPNREGKIVVRAEVDGVECVGSVVTEWGAHDMAVIRVKTRKYKVRAAKVAQQVDYAQGLTVCKCGYPGAGPRHVATGTSLGQQSTGNNNPEWLSVQYDLFTRSGDSGCGLFRKSDHALIGVVWGGSNGVGFATRIESIWQVLDSLKENGWLTEKLLLVLPPQSVLECDK